MLVQLVSYYVGKRKNACGRNINAARNLALTKKKYSASSNHTKKSTRIWISKVSKDLVVFLPACYHGYSLGRRRQRKGKKKKRKISVCDQIFTGHNIAKTVLYIYLC